MLKSSTFLSKKSIDLFNDITFYLATCHRLARRRYSSVAPPPYCVCAVIPHAAVVITPQPTLQTWLSVQGHIEQYYR
jgi:hypothetical protein